MNKRVLPSIIAFAAALACVVGLAACSSGSGTETSSDAGTSASAATSPAAGESTPAMDAATTFDADAYMQSLEKCVQQIRTKTDFEPEIAIVLGSGLGHFAERIDVVAKIPYEDIDGFPAPTVEGHEGNLVFGTLGGKNVVAMQGRLHYYEGYSTQEVVMPLRVLHLLGADTVVLTNAVGAINPDFRVGDFVTVRDHISLFVPSPLIGENIDELGSRFPDMTEAYDRELIELASQIGSDNGITVHQGVFVQTAGPQFETPAEIELFRTLGADTVGMSTAVEAIAARHMGMRVCDINCVTNMAAGMEDARILPEDVNSAANEAEDDFTTLLSELIAKM